MIVPTQAVRIYRTPGVAESAGKTIPRLSEIEILFLTPCGAHHGYCPSLSAKNI